MSKQPTRLQACRVKQTPFAATVGAVVIGVLLLPCVARAAERAITVSATGEIKVRPTTVEIAILASGSAELSTDALVKYRTSIRRTLDSFEKLKMEHLKIEPEDITIGSPNANPNQAFIGIQVAEPGDKTVRPPVNISRTLRLRLRGAQDLKEDQLIETIVKLIDVAKDSGNSIVGEESQAMVSFSVDQADEVRDKASQAAFAQARTKAAKYAALAGARLGDVQSVEETVSELNTVAMIWESQYGISPSDASSAAAGGGKLTSHTLGEIPARVTLKVSFALLPLNKDEK